MLEEEEPRIIRKDSDASLMRVISSGPSVNTIVLLILPRVIYLVFFAVLFVWIYQAEGGIGWNEDTVFGVHALLMSLFVVFFTTEALLAYRAPIAPVFFRKYVCVLVSFVCLFLLSQ